MHKLDSLKAKNIKDTYMRAGDKIRFTFTIENEADALTCYNYFIERNEY